MFTPLVQHTGTLRRATLADVPVLSQLLARAGTDNLPVTAAEFATLIERGHLLVFDVGAGALGAAALVEPVEAGSARRGVFRYLAVDPALVGPDLRYGLMGAMRQLCDGLDLAVIDDGSPSRELVHALHGELARRFVYLTVVLLALPRVLASMGHNEVAVTALVWSALALFTAARTPPIPRAIVHRRRPARLRTWADAALLRYGELPMASCAPHALPPAWSIAPVTPPEPPPAMAPDAAPAK